MRDLLRTDHRLCALHVCVKHNYLLPCLYNYDSCIHLRIYSFTYSKDIYRIQNCFPHFFPGPRKIFVQDDTKQYLLMLREIQCDLYTTLIYESGIPTKNILYLHYLSQHGKPILDSGSWQLGKLTREPVWRSPSGHARCATVWPLSTMAPATLVSLLPLDTPVSHFRLTFVSLSV